MKQKEFLEMVICHMSLPLALQTQANSTDMERLLELGKLLWSHAQFVRCEHRTDFLYTTLACRTVRYLDIGYSSLSLDKAAKVAVTQALARTTTAEQLT